MKREDIVWAPATVEMRERAGPQGKVLPAAGLAFLLLAAQFMTLLMLAALMAPGYDIAGGASATSERSLRRPGSSTPR